MPKGQEGVRRFVDVGFYTLAALAASILPEYAHLLCTVVRLEVLTSRLTRFAPVLDTAESSNCKLFAALASGC